MPPSVKWKCPHCGKERIMSPDVTLVLCQCNYKNMVRIGKGTKSKEAQQSL